jgi:hypothetical protein
MRAAPLIVAGLALLAAPVAAQEKTKTKQPAAPIAIELLELCELYADGDVLATTTAGEQGWQASETETDSIFVRSFDATRTIEGIGDAALFSLIESYPQLTLGYCRIDIASPQGDVGVAQLDTLERLTGDLQVTESGTYGAWNGTAEGRDYLLLANQDEFGFGLQLTLLEAIGAGE